MRAKKNKRPPRKRGGASLPCTACGGDSRVEITKRFDGEVERIRVCKVCETKFFSEERPIAVSRFYRPKEA